MRRVVWVMLAFGLVLSGCDLQRGHQPSVIVIAVEGLTFDSVNCDNEALLGFRVLCDESVRFTHAFTPSSMSQPVIASLLTGLYPFDHHVRNNGSQFLSARFKTLAEVALENSYHTQFISGGAPIWRKSGLAQGFEVFDDNIEFAPGLFYRPVGEVFHLHREWLQQLSDRNPTLSFLYLADLQFPRSVTYNNEGDARGLGFGAQLEEIDESLADFFSWLKQSGRWNSTHIVVVGLNTVESPNPEILAPQSLRSVTTQVSLFIKPARKERDNVIQWAVDRNVSLVDVGATMYEWLGASASPSSLNSLEAQSLVSALTRPEPNWEEGRLLLIESAWANWIDSAPIRWAVRQNQFLYIHDEKPLIFNTLTDRMENLPLKKSDPLWLSVNSEIMALMEKSKQTPFRWDESPRWTRAIQRAKESQDFNPGGSGELWSALRERRWAEVRRLSIDKGSVAGRYIAEMQLGDKPGLPRDPCLRLIFSESENKQIFRAECDDEEMVALYVWEKNEGDRQSVLDRLSYLVAQRRFDDEVGLLNLRNELRWDVDRDKESDPSALDFVVTLKRFAAIEKKLKY